MRVDVYQEKKLRESITYQLLQIYTTCISFKYNLYKYICISCNLKNKNKKQKQKREVQERYGKTIGEYI